MASFDLYGFTNVHIESLKDSLGNALGILFLKHDSSFRGGEYYRSGEVNSENFCLQRNYDCVDDDVAYSEYEEFSSLFFVNETLRSDHIKQVVTNLGHGGVLLKHYEIP